jgi:hypothetical protein
MNRFLLGFISSAILGLLGYPLLFLAQLGTPTAGATTNKAKLNYKDEQVGLKSSPKLILVGGSSVVFGLSAKTLELRLNLPCYNYGSWASLGAEYILYRAQQILRPGDTVLLALEYEILDWPGSNRQWLNQDFLRFVSSADPTYVRKMPNFDRVLMSYSMPPEAIIGGLLPRRSSESNVESFENEFNQWGDAITNTLEKRSKDDSVQRAASETFANGLTASPKGTEIVLEFSRWCSANGVKVIATFPNLAQNASYSNDRIQSVEGIIRSMYAKCEIPMVGTPQQAMFDAECYFDTNYHLLDTFAIQRTELLIPELKFQLERLRDKK